MLAITLVLTYVAIVFGQSTAALRRSHYSHEHEGVERSVKKGVGVDRKRSLRNLKKGKGGKGRSKSTTTRPTRMPTPIPTKEPTDEPSRTPSNFPSKKPSDQPSITPSSTPSNYPTKHPSSQPSAAPDSTLSPAPSSQPTAEPSQSPTMQPSTVPSPNPTPGPSMDPTLTPSPSYNPTPSATTTTATVQVRIVLVAASVFMLALMLAKRMISQGLMSRPTVRNPGQYIRPPQLGTPGGLIASRRSSLDTNDENSDLATGGGKIRSSSNMKQDSGRLSLGSLAFPIRANSMSSSPWSSGRSIGGHHDTNLAIRRVLWTSSPNTSIKRNDVASFPILGSPDLLDTNEENISRNQSELSQTMNELAKNVTKSIDDLEAAVPTDL